MNKKGFSTVAVVGLVSVIAICVAGYFILAGENPSAPNGPRGVSMEAPPIDFGRVAITIQSVTDDFYGGVRINKILSYERSETSAFKALELDESLDSAKFLYSTQPARLLDPQVSDGTWPVAATATALVGGELRITKLPQGGGAGLELPKDCTEEFCFIRDSSPAASLPGIHVGDRIIADFVYDGEKLGIKEYEVIK